MTGVSLGQGGTYQAARPFLGVGGAWKPVTTMFVGQGGVWKPVYSSAAPAPETFGVVVAPDANAWFFDGLTYVAGPFTCTASGGVPPYSYSWECTEGWAETSTGEATFFRSYFRTRQYFTCRVLDSATGDLWTGGEIFP